MYPTFESQFDIHYQGCIGYFILSDLQHVCISTHSWFTELRRRYIKNQPTDIRMFLHIKKRLRKQSSIPYNLPCNFRWIGAILTCTSKLMQARKFPTVSKVIAKPTSCWLSSSRFLQYKLLLSVLLCKIATFTTVTINANNNQKINN